MSMQIYLKLSFREALLDVLKVELADDQAPLNPVVVRTSQPDDMLCALDAEMAADAITANLDRSYACGRAFATKVAMSNSEEMLVSVADMEMFAAWANHRYVTLRTQALQAAWRVSHARRRAGTGPTHGPGSADHQRRSHP